jgi:hypothetical protein
MSDMYISNNGNGWAVFKENPTHKHKRPWAYIAESKEWSLVMATYYRTREEAQKLLESLKG